MLKNDINDSKKCVTISQNYHGSLKNYRYVGDVSVAMIVCLALGLVGLALGLVDLAHWCHGG